MTTPNQNLDSIKRAISGGMEEILDRQGLSLKPPKRASTVAIGKAFTEFYVREIAYHIDNLTDTNTIERGLECDGKNDLGIDFIYEKPESNKFWICQSKYKENPSPLLRGEISNFFDIRTRFKHPGALNKAKRLVRESLKDLNEQSSVIFVLLTNGQASEENKREFERLKAKADTEDGADNYEWKLADLPQIDADEKQIYSEQSSPPTINIPICSESEKGHILSNEIQGNSEKHKTITIIISGTKLYELCELHHNSLFNYNIRGFLGDISKNKNIIKTLAKEPEFFYLYNNGISAICSNLEIKENIAHCEEFQIINGAQTAGCIHRYGSLLGSKPNLDKVMILLRITQIKSREDEKELKREIITNNNTQNIIRDADFRSNDLVQINLKNRFDASKFQYRASRPYLTLVYCPKRSDISNRRTSDILVSMEDMAKSLYAFLKDKPHKLNSQSQFLFDGNEIKGSYWDLFGKDGKEIDAVDAETANQFAAIAILKIYLDYRLTQDMKGKSDDTLAGMTYRSGHHFLWAFGYVVRNLYPSEQKKIYDNIVNGAVFNEGGFVPSWYNHIRSAIHTVLSMSGSHIDPSTENSQLNLNMGGSQSDLSTEGGQPNKTLNFKMWLRNKSKVKLIMERLKFIKEIDGLPPV